MVLTFALFCGMIGEMRTETEACATAFWAGTNGYDNRDLRFRISNSAFVPVIAPASSNFNHVLDTFSNGGWNSITSRVRITNVSTNASGANTVVVIGENMPPVAGWLTFGEIRPYDRLGRPAALASDWSDVDIVMNNGLANWRLICNNDAQRTRVFENAFRHEVGHVLKLVHPGCSTIAVMHQGIPAALPGGSSFVGEKLQAHDSTNLQVKWG